MFLKRMTRWRYPDASAPDLNGAELIEFIEYRPDGVIRHVVEDKRIDERRTVDRHSVDVVPNWEPVPAFGDWASIARYDRDSPPDQNGAI